MKDVKPVTISEIRLVLEQLRDSDGSISRYIELRHMLTENVNRNLYNNAAREEGREALQIRDALDETIFSITENDMQSGSMEATENFVKGIMIENLAEQFEFIEKVVKAGNGKAENIKFGLRKLIDDPDKFERYSVPHQQMIKDAADYTFFEKLYDLIGLSFLSNLLARGKTEEILRSLETDVKALT